VAISMWDWIARYGLLIAVALFFVMLDAGDWINLARKRCEGRPRPDYRDTRRYAYGSLALAVVFLVALIVDFTLRPAWPLWPDTATDWLALVVVLLPAFALLPRLIRAALRLRAVRRSPLYRVRAIAPSDPTT